MPEKPHLFLEFHGTENSVKEQIEQFVSLGEDNGLSNFQSATKTEERNNLWRARHNAYYAGKALRPGSEGFVTDVCVPISALAECISKTRAIVEESGLIAPLVGHVGDGNFHLLLLIEPDNSQELQRAKQVAEKLSELALELEGTVTGEHGVGTGKKKYMQAEHGEAYQVMGLIKSTMDPNNIMNPGKLVTIN